MPTLIEFALAGVPDAPVIRKAWATDAAVLLPIVIATEVPPSVPSAIFQKIAALQVVPELIAVALNSVAHGLDRFVIDAVPLDLLTMAIINMSPALTVAGIVALWTVAEAAVDGVTDCRTGATPPLETGWRNRMA